MKRIIIIIIILLTGNALFGVDGKKRKRDVNFWLSFVFGKNITQMNSDSSGPIGFNFNFKYKNHIFLISFLSPLTSFSLFPGSYGGETVQTENLSEKSFIYQYNFLNHPQGLFSLGGGVSIIQHEKEGYGIEDFAKKGYGLSLQAQFMVKGRAVGFGLIGYANINKYKSYAGVLFALSFGILK